jgi:hypothetical protein
MSNIKCNWVDRFQHYREQSFKFWLIMNTKLRNINVEESFEKWVNVRYSLRNDNKCFYIKIHTIII